MYATKLMMNLKNEGYVEDSSLVYKVESAKLTTGIKKTIPNVVNGDKAFTFCGTLGNITGCLYHAINYILGISRYSRYICVTNIQSNAAVLGNSAITPCTMSDVQPYIAFTLTCPTPSTQHITLAVENGQTYESHLSLPYTFTDAVFRVHQAVDPIDLVLVYNRVLTRDELEKNYQAFLANHR